MLSHEKIEKNVGLMIVLTVLTVSVGGLLFVSGMVVMAWNVLKTAASGRAVKVPVPAVNPAHA